MLKNGEEFRIKVVDDYHVWIGNRQFISLTRVGEMLKEREETVRKEYRSDISILEKFRALGYEPAALDLMIDFWKEHHPKATEGPEKIDLTFFKTGGPYGDCTSNYDVHVPLGTTVGAFISHVIKEHSVKQGEWGDIIVRPHATDARSWGKKLYSCSYSRGESKCDVDLPDDIANREIKAIRANGGWSCMGYDVYI